jgi:hypothetical protein
MAADASNESLASFPIQSVSSERNTSWEFSLTSAEFGDLSHLIAPRYYVKEPTGRGDKGRAESYMPAVITENWFWWYHTSRYFVLRVCSILEELDEKLILVSGGATSYFSYLIPRLPVHLFANDKLQLTTKWGFSLP